MKRLEKFRELESHAWYKRLFQKLTKSDIKICEEWLNDNKGLDKNSFAYLTNRMYVDKPETNKKKLSRRNIIVELLQASNC